MCKSAFFFATIFHYAPCTGQSEVVPGQSGFHEKKLRYNKFYILKSKLIHRQQCYLQLYRKNITQKVVWNTKQKLYSLFQRTLHISMFCKKSTVSNVLYLDILDNIYCIRSI